MVRHFLKCHVTVYCSLKGVVHKVCHAFLMIFDPPSPCHKLSQILDPPPPLKVCHTSEQKVNKQI